MRALRILIVRLLPTLLLTFNLQLPVDWKVKWFLANRIHLNWPSPEPQW
jgi:hypothetical protein